MDKILYQPKGVCSRSMEFEVEDGIIKNVRIIGGCPGNLLGISSLITGMNCQEVISKLEGIRCGGKNTSCPDQIAKALKEFYHE